MNYTSPGGWQGYQTGNQQWGTGGMQMQQNGFGQNGGGMPVQQNEPPFVGRFINQIEEVMPREVPMDGRAAIFPTQTLEEIYLKAWDRNGTIKTFRYILDPTQNFNAPQPEASPGILDRLDQLEQKFNEAQQQSKSANRRNSKGGEVDA